MIDDMGIFRATIGLASLNGLGQRRQIENIMAGPADMVLLGAFGLEGLRVRVDLISKELVPVGPSPAAVAA